MNELKSYKNRDLINLSSNDYEKLRTTSFIPDDFEGLLEWATLIISQKMKQIKFAKWLDPVTNMHFDKSFLFCSDNNVKVFSLFSDMQASPAVFPNINVRFINLSKEGIDLVKFKELDLKSRRNYRIKTRYAYDVSVANYISELESFYAFKEGYGVNESFFTPVGLAEGLPAYLPDRPEPFSLRPGYSYDKPTILRIQREREDISHNLAMCYQVALTMFYEWSLYLRDGDSPGIIIPIDPILLKEIYNTSILKFPDRKRMIHFVAQHYRRKIADPSATYDVFVNRYLRGECKFNFKGFYSEIIPPKYDLNRAKTKKQFINHFA